MAVRRLEACGATVVEVELDATPLNYREVLSLGLHLGVDAYLQTLGRHAPVASLAEVVAFNATDLPNRAPYGQDLLEEAAATAADAARYTELAVRNRVEATARLQQAMDEANVSLLCSLSNHLTGVYASAGFPALCLPLTRRTTGEPVGLTLVAPYLADGALLAAAFALEQQLMDATRRATP